MAVRLQLSLNAVRDLQLHETTTIYHSEILRLALEKAKDVGLTVSISQERKGNYRGILGHSMYDCKYLLGSVIKMIDNGRFSHEEMYQNLSRKTSIETLDFVFDKNNSFESRKDALQIY